MLVVVMILITMQGARFYGLLMRDWNYLVQAREQLGFDIFFFWMMAKHLNSEQPFLYAAMNAVHRLRGPSGHVPPQQRGSYIRAIFKDAVASSPFLRSAFNGIWSSRGFQL